MKSILTIGEILVEIMATDKGNESWSRSSWLAPLSLGPGDFHRSGR